MSLNLLEIVREARGRLGQSLPTSVAGNSDPGVIQMKGMLNEFLEDLVVRKFWQSNVIEGHFTALAQESQGELETLFPGFEGILPDTVYNRTSRLQIGGGLACGGIHGAGLEWGGMGAGILHARVLRGLE